MDFVHLFIHYFTIFLDIKKSVVCNVKHSNLGVASGCEFTLLLTNVRPRAYDRPSFKGVDDQIDVLEIFIVVEVA